MTDTEKILNLLEINKEIPALVTDEEGKIISNNDIWSEKFSSSEREKSIYKLFDKNTSLLVQNSFIDAKAFLKVKRRDVQILTLEELQDFKLIISPFKLDDKLFFYFLLFNNTCTEDLLVYPTLDDNSISVKYKEIVTQLKDSFPSTLIEKKNLQFSIDIEKESIAIKDKTQFLFTNNSFYENFKVKERLMNILATENIIPLELSSKIQLAENELNITHSPFVIEKKDYHQSTIKYYNRILLYPILNKNCQVQNIIIIGSVKLKENGFVGEESEQKKEGTEVSIMLNDEINIENSELAKIIYDKNNFDILEANSAASEFYGYELETIREMNITQLFLPEDMQKLLMQEQSNNKYIFNQIKGDGSTVEVNIERKNIIWHEKEAFLDTIVLNQTEEEVFELEEFSEKNAPAYEPGVDKLNQPVENKNNQKTEFLASLFHELLTPVNVILGFVQELIDSIDNPTEEQEESAQIIKDNQQILLQSMNTAVQYAQLEENKINLNIEKFDINNYLVDLRDSFSRVSEKENVNVVFEDIHDTLSIEHDRAKLLAAISYFIKFVIKLTDLSKVVVSFKIIDNDFCVLIKDSGSEISENVSSDMLEIYNPSILSDKTHYGLSPITIKLAKKLNELLSVKVIKIFETKNDNSIAFVTPAILKEKLFGKESDISKGILENADSQIEEKNEEVIEDETIELDTKIAVSEDVVIENREEIANGEVDEKIVEDIQEEEEIVTEEIASVETIHHDISDLSNLSCLFIDDTVDAQLLFKYQMKDFKLLKVSSNLTEALPLLNKYNFDLIIVDVNLNDTYNGFDALKIIRQFSNYNSTPIIAVTAYSFEGDKEKFINFGFTDYIVKPLLREQLLKSLEVIIS